MNNPKSILIIGATHGNEHLGPKFYEYLLHKRSLVLEYCSFLIGNPRAYAESVRYIDADLNRSFAVDVPESYEARRAREITKYIEVTQPTLIIDMHTTAVVQPNIHIVSSIDDTEVRAFIRSSHLSTILQVKPLGDIAHKFSNLIAYEVPNRNISKTLFESIELDLIRYIRSEKLPMHRRLYRMTDKIYSSEVSKEQAKQFVNFQMSDQGYIPVMTGNNSYRKQTNYLGFKATAPVEININ